MKAENESLSGIAHMEDLLASLLVMAWMVEARDPYTGGHLWRVSRLCQILAAEAGLPNGEVARISLGGFLHDLGKIGIPDAILHKPERLTQEEFDVIRTHPTQGVRVLTAHPLAAWIKGAVYSHHERPDGLGYPLGLVGAAIPVEARIVAVCDAFDAMTSSRPYRKGMDIGRALDIIEGGLGSQFDAELGKRFVDMGRQGMLEHVVGHSDLGIPLQECPMCGPTVIVRKSHRDGDHVYCRHCQGEMRVVRQQDSIGATPTGRKVSPALLDSEADMELISRLVREASQYISGTGLQRTGHQPSR